MAYINKHILTAVAARENGEIFELEGYGAAGLSGDQYHILTKTNTCDMPYGSELMRLPDRKVVVFNLMTDAFQVLETNPYAPGERIYPVAVFNSPGYVNLHCCAYDDTGVNTPLPLFSYGAVGFGKKQFRSAALKVDDEPRQDLRRMPISRVQAGVKQHRKTHPDNRLIRHLETCALEYGCPAGKNFFLGRYEAPLPTSVVCNAACMGCISLQTDNNIRACQDRIAFIPTPQEIAEIALSHIKRVDKAVVSFGQGCEGEPLTSGKILVEAVKRIRAHTDKGTINLNSNASLPQVVDQLCAAGLDSMRVSMNSVRPECYKAYFRPKSYTFDNVANAIQTAKSHGIFVAINYLNCPGFTDSERERRALFHFIQDLDIDMIQWRNLNFDPRYYHRIMAKITNNGHATGMGNMIETLTCQFPKLIHGYFNPPKERHPR
ncbi:MAG: radical SAM protein [Desulfobacterales bacterium]|nr:MAG: radical SAM protein [Desulfobacterales bacterium]